MLSRSPHCPLHGFPRLRASRPQKIRVLRRFFPSQPCSRDCRNPPLASPGFRAPRPDLLAQPVAAFSVWPALKPPFGRRGPDSTRLKPLHCLPNGGLSAGHTLKAATGCARRSGLGALKPGLARGGFRQSRGQGFEGKNRRRTRIFWGLDARKRGKPWSGQCGDLDSKDT